MGNFFEDVGRTGGSLTRATQNITNLALKIRQQRSQEELLPLRREVLELDIENKRISTNINRVQLEELRDKERIGNRPIEVNSLKKMMNNPGQFQKDYEYMKSSGYVSVLSDGTEVVLAKDLKRFRDEVQDTVAYKQSFNTENLKRYTTEQTNIKNQINAIEQEYYTKGKTTEDAQKDKRIQQLLPSLQTATLGRTKAMLNDKALSDVIGKLISKGHKMSAIDKWATTGDTSELVLPQTGGGKATDFERAYQQHIDIKGNEAVTRAEFKTGPYAMPKGELSDDAVLDHFTRISMMEGQGTAAEAQVAFQRYSDYQKTMSKREAYNKAKEQMIRGLGSEHISGDYRTLWGDDTMFTSH